MLVRSMIKRMADGERKAVRDGAFAVGALTGGFAYFQYRDFIRKEFLRSEAHYRFSMPLTNCTPWKQMYFTWYKMPDEEFMVYHRFKPYHLLGQLDLSKEVLIPRTKDGQDGFDVLNPLYCYEGGKLSFKNAFAGEDPVKIERAAIVLNRGWIPARFRDKRSRPNERNSTQLVRVTGCWRKGKNIHDYKYPNNPDNNEWHNLCLEDIGLFWDLPNFDEQKYYYFHAVNLGERSSPDMKQWGGIDTDKPDDIIVNHYGWRWDEKRVKMLWQGFGAVGVTSMAVCAMSSVF